MKQVRIIHKEIKMPNLLAANCWITNVISADRHNTTPQNGSIFFLLLPTANLNQTKLTREKISKKLMLPAIEIFSSGIVFTNRSVNTAVRIKPIGLFHKSLLNATGDSLSIDIW